MNRPQPNEYASFYAGYIAAVPDDVLSTLEEQADTFLSFIKNIPAQVGDFAYAEGKWTLKQLVGHVIDTERIMTYRLLTIVRNDQVSLPGFDENEYVVNAHFQDRSLLDLATEFHYLRRANCSFYNSLNEIELSRSGVANGNQISAKALLYIIAGHVMHHRNIIEERYLKNIGAF